MKRRPGEGGGTAAVLLCFCVVFLTSHRQPEGNVHVAQVALAALDQQLGRRAAVAVEGALLAGRHAALLEELCAVGHREGGEAAGAGAALPVNAGRPVANALGHQRAGITWLTE